MSTKVMPMLPLRGKIVFPHTAIYFDVSRKKSILALEEAMNNDQLIFLPGQIDAHIDDPKPEDIYDVGTVARLKQLVKLPQGLVRVLAEGVCRGKITEVCETEPAFRVEILEEALHENVLEDNIKECPELWLWTHKRWKRTRKGYAEREARRARDLQRLRERNNG